jgi:MFS family permease
MTTLPTHFLRERDYLSVSLNHFFIDVLNSGRNLIVAMLAIALGLSNAQVGIVLLLYNVGSALMQPLFGWLADRIGARWLVVGGMGWSIFFYGLSAVASDWVALMAVTVAGIGSGAFHPPGTMIASQVSQKYRNRATALFFTSGQLGLFMGPVFTGILLEVYGRPGYLVLPALAFVAFLSAWQWVVDKPAYQAARLASRQAAATAANGLALAHGPAAEPDYHQRQHRQHCRHDLCPQAVHRNGLHAQLRRLALRGCLCWVRPWAAWWVVCWPTALTAVSSSSWASGVRPAPLLLHPPAGRLALWSALSGRLL